MSFLTDVQVAQQGNSAELYALTYSGREAFFTSYYRDVVHGGVAYKAVTIARSEIAVEFGPEEVQCTVRGGLNETFSFLRLGIPVTNVELAITRLFLDTDTTCDIFTGRLKTYSMRENEAACEFTSTLFFVLQQTFNQLTVWGTCGNMLFDERCALARSDYKCTGIITEIGTTTEGYPYIIVENSGADAFGEGPQDKEEQYYALGMAQLADYYRMISDSEDADGAGRKRLVLEFAFPDGHVAVGDTIDLWPGCDKISHTCYIRFSNYENFWGYQAVKALSRWNNVRLEVQGYDLELSKRNTPVYYGAYSSIGAVVLLDLYHYGTSTPTIWRYQSLLCWGTITPIALSIVDTKPDAGASNPPRIIWHDPPATDITEYFALFNTGDGTVAVPFPLPPNGWPDSSDYEAWPQFPYLASIGLWIDSGSTPFPTGWPVADALATQHYGDHRYELQITFERVPTTPWAAFDRIEYETTAELPPGMQNGFRNVYVGVNPVSALYEILTNTHWGLGVATDDIDAASFAAAAEYCYDKGYGIAIEILQKTKLRQVVDDICDAGGLMLCYSADGKIKCMAINDTSSSVATVTDQDMVESEYTAGSWDATFNRLVAKQSNYRMGVVYAQERWTGNYELKQDNLPTPVIQNEANYMLTRSWRETGFNAALLISTGMPARTRRMYEKLYELSYPHSVITCRVDQRFSNVSVGDCVMVQSVRYAVSGAFRVVGLTHGDDDARHIQLKMQQIQESTFSMDYVSELLATGYDEEGNPVVIPQRGEVMTFDAYQDTSIVSTVAYTDFDRIRVAWYGHTVLSGALLTNHQDATNYGCTINDEGAGLISITLRSPQFDDAVQGNATGQLAVQVWEV